MAGGASKYLFLCLLFIFAKCSSGTRETSPVSRSSTQLTGNVARVFVETPRPKQSRRKELETTKRDTTYPPTIVTVPATVPGTTAPPTVPSTTPVPVNSPPPTTKPVATPAPPQSTNPVTTYPPPAPTTPPPATTGSPPAVPGQSWCVAKSGAQQTALQSALDYACGIGGADCSAIQQGASCYNPNTLQNHASYAFNSYYQKKPVQTSCDFGGTAVLTNSNPSSGSCVYLTSSSTPSSPPATGTTPSPPTTTIPAPPTTTTPPPATTTPTMTPPPATTTPTMTPPPATTTPTTTPPPGTTTPTATPSPPTSTAGGTAPGSTSTPPLLNASDPAPGSATVIGDSPSSSMNSTSTSTAANFMPFIHCIVLITSSVTASFILDM